MQLDFVLQECIIESREVDDRRYANGTTPTVHFGLSHEKVGEAEMFGHPFYRCEKVLL